jgi:hypothetical protein
MAKLPDVDNLVDSQFFQVPLSDGLLAGFSYDSQTRSLIQKESQVIVPSRHGMTHVAEDPVPDASCDLHGLMSADDKCKLDAMLQMRLGILGFQGSGFPDDGGFLVGDVVLAAGSEFISIERIGNTIRFTVDSPLPLNCACEECARIFWIQDESEARAIRPPSCNGVMPDVNTYGELKIYTFPESTLLDVTDPLATLNRKGEFPALVFKRFDDAVTPGQNEFEMVLKRNANLTSNVGWAFTPGAQGIAQCVWFMGNANDGSQMKFELAPEVEPGLLGSLLFMGHLITKQMAVVVDVDQNVLSNNQYVLRKWDIQGAKPLGQSFTATNVWMYNNPENSPTAISNPRTLTLDSTKSIIPIGSLIEIWEFEITRNSQQRVTRHFFSKEPQLNPSSLWALADALQFGDLFAAREEINDPQSDTAVSASEIDVSDKRLLEKTLWGLTNFEDRLLLSDDGGEVESSDGIIRREPSGEPVNNDIVADIDPTLPGLRVVHQAKSLIADINGDGIVDDEDLRLFMCAYNTTIFDAKYNPGADFNADGKVDVRDLSILGQQFDLNIEKVSDRPVFLWHRQNHKNILLKFKIGMPDSVQQKTFPPYDLLLSAPVDSFDDTYLKIVKRGVFTTGPFAGLPFVVAKGMRWEDMPDRGVLRILTGAFRNGVWPYQFKAAFANWDDDGITLIGSGDVFPFDEDFPIGDLATGCDVEATGADVTGCPTDGCPPIESTAATEVTAAISEIEAVEVPANSTVVELLRQDFTAPCVRFQFSVNTDSGSESVQLQVKVGLLDMSVPYELNDSIDPVDDLVRGFRAGAAVSRVFTQSGIITDGVGLDVTSDPEGFRVYSGGELDVPVNGQVEKWNDVEIMFRDGQVWVWWNGLLITPDTVESASLTSPVAVNTPYFPLNPQVAIGKVAFRLFPGATMRFVEVRDQLEAFTEFSKGQLQLTN